MTLQQHFNLITEGKGNKAQFLKQARSLFPEYFNQYTDFNTATNVLKSKQIISEAAGGVVAKGFSVYDWKKILGEEVKATEKETSKEAADANKNAFQPSDMKNADNINFNEIMKGFFAEMYDEKNKEKTGDEIKAMVVKNLAKDCLYYTKNGNFSTMGVGYTTEAPGLGEPKEPKGKHKSSGYGDLKENKEKRKLSLKQVDKKDAKGLALYKNTEDQDDLYYYDGKVLYSVVDGDKKGPSVRMSLYNITGLQESISQERYEEELANTVAKYVKDPDDIDKEMSNYYSKGYQGFSDALKANLSRDRDLDTLVQMMHDEETLRREQGLEEQDIQDRADAINMFARMVKRGDNNEIANSFEANRDYGMPRVSDMVIILKKYGKYDEIMSMVDDDFTDPAGGSGLSSHLEEQKLRLLIRNLIKEELK
jgi:hypothetical protein